MNLLAQPLEVASPENINKIVFELRDGVPHYSVLRFGREVVSPSPLGFELREMPSLKSNFTVIDHTISPDFRTHFLIF